MNIKFKKHYVTNGIIKARIRYSIGCRIDNRKCVTLYAKDYTRNLGKIFLNLYVNETDSMTDYFDEGKVNLFEDNIFYIEAKKIAESF